MDRHVESQFDLNGLGVTLGPWHAAGRGPLYQRLADALRAAILRGDLAAGGLLPPERLLAQHLAVSRSTVVAAYDLLRADHLVERRQGSGTRVRHGQAGPGAASAGAPNARGLELSRTLNRNTLFRGLNDRQDEVIDLLGAYLLDADGLPAAALDGIEREIAELAHTAGYAPLGYPPLRAAIARRLSRRGLPTEPRQVLVTAGAQQAIYLSAWLYLQRGDSAVVENPTYPGALDALSAFGAHLVGVPTRRAGVDPDRLRQAVERTSPRLVYLIPSYQNPTGGVLSSHARRQLASLVQSHGLALVDDDSLSDLGLHDDQPPPPVATFAPDSPILTIGSLSKICWAGLRVGWVRAQEPVIAQLARLKAVTDLGGSMATQVIATRLMDSVDQMRQQRGLILRERLALVSDLLGSQLPDWSWEPPLGGLCLWVRLPYGSATEFSQVALRHGVSVVPGSVASCDGSFGDHLRLPFGHSPRVLEAAVSRLAAAWRAYAPAEGGRVQSVAVIV
jgi:DNA-binding transcriptional MocR family regulator